MDTAVTYYLVANMTFFMTQVLAGKVNLTANLIPRSFIDEAEGEIWSNQILYTLLPVRNVMGNERVDAEDKSSIFNGLNNEFDRAMMFFSDKQWLYVHLKYEPTNFLLFLVFLTSNSTLQLV